MAVVPLPHPDSTVPGGSAPYWLVPVVGPRSGPSDSKTDTNRHKYRLTDTDTHRHTPTQTHTDTDTDTQTHTDTDTDTDTRHVMSWSARAIVR